MTDTKKAPPSSAAARWAKRMLGMALGIALGLVIAEMAFRARDDGAFPHLNCYQADEDIGVALEPGCTTRVRVATNPPTDIAINAAGTRGPELGAPADDEILVLGDSQAFGLGVGDAETFAAVLGEQLHRPVVNAGVPTHGPVEYLAVARRIFETRHPRTVVYTVNMANDFFEHDRPDVERHAVWDHWAVRRETMPEHVTEFPGRDFLYRRSHAFFALRQALHQTDASIEGVRDVGFPSEGNLHDLVQEGTSAAEQHTAADAAYRAALAEHTSRIDSLGGALASADGTIDEALERVDPEVGGTRLGDYEDYGSTVYGSEVLLAAAGRPGDIVSVEDGEESRDILVTASLLTQALRMRRTWIADSMRFHRLSEAVDARELAEEAFLSERARAVDETPVPSLLEPRIRELVDLCAEHGAQLIVVGLPLDVLVSETEFAKYGAAPTDVSASRVLLTDLVASAEGMGVRAIDTTDALRAAEPGAFLDGDLHMSASGHRAVAGAIAERLAAPAPLSRPHGDLPEGRTPVPTPDEFVHDLESTVIGSTAAHCVTHRVREWARISCRRYPRNQPTGVAVVSGGRGEAMTVTTEWAATLLAPMLAGDPDLVADFHWLDRTQRFTAHWPEGDAEPTMNIAAATPAAQPTASVSADAARLCACHQEVFGDGVCSFDDDDYDWDCTTNCAELYGQPSAECMAQYADDCAHLLGCVRGDPESPVTCEGGRAPALATHVCLPLCAIEAPGREAVPCATGTCTPWQGAAVCVP